MAYNPNGKLMYAKKSGILFEVIWKSGAKKVSVLAAKHIFNCPQLNYLKGTFTKTKPSFSTAKTATVLNTKYYSTTRYSDSPTCRSVDLNGDNKKDAVKIRAYSNGIKVFSNDKCVYNLKKSLSGDWGASMKLMRMKNGRAFLYLSTYLEGTGYHDDLVLTYKNGKLRQALDCTKLTSKTGAYRHYVNSIKVSGNTMIIYNNAFAGKFIDVEYNYTFKNGSLKRTSLIGKWKGTKSTTSMRANLPVYSSTTCKYLKFRLANNQRVTINRVYINGGPALLEVKTANGKTGWSKLTDTSLSGLTVN